MARGQGVDAVPVTSSGMHLRHRRQELRYPEAQGIRRDMDPNIESSNKGSERKLGEEMIDQSHMGSSGSGFVATRT